MGIGKETGGWVIGSLSLNSFDLNSTKVLSAIPADCLHPKWQAASNFQIFYAPVFPPVPQNILSISGFVAF